MPDHRELRVLGGVELRRGGVAVPVGGPKPRLLLCMLVHANRCVVSADRLCEELWGDDQPNDPRAVLQANVSRLRRLLEPDLRIASRAGGYVLEADSAQIDVMRFEDLVREARSASDPDAAIDVYTSALAIFRGTPFEEFADRGWARGEVTRLQELRLAAREEQLQLRLDHGDCGAVVPDLEALVAEEPLRELPWLLLATALHRSGRSPEALRRIASFAGILRDELGLDPSPSIRVLERQILDNDPTLRKTASPAPLGLSRVAPVEMTSLVGRTADAARVVLGLDSHRLVTLVGPGGVGKTRLAMRVASDVWDSRSGQVFVVELAPVHDEASTVAAIATALDVQQRQHLSVEETLAEYLRGRCALLVLDNCEHLRTTVARLTNRLLTSCPDLTVLTTSREVLGLAAEHVWRVEPLAVPAPETDLESLGNSPAVRLFVERARQSNSSFVLGPDNIAAVAEIVRRVDGLPLAIELAAARSRAVSPVALAQRLQQRFDLLDHAQLTQTDRHSTVRELVGWSYNLLTQQEKLLFVRASVFPGSFDLESAETICSDAPLDRVAVAPLLAALVDKSMVQLVDARLGRYRLLETLRQFGRAQLVETESDQIRAGHACCYLELAELCADALDSAEEAAASRRLEAEFDNMRSAFAYMIDRADLDGGGRLVIALREFAFRSLRAEVITWADDLSAVPSFAATSHHPTILGIAAYGRFVRGDLDESIRLSELALAAAARLGTTSNGLAERTLGNAMFYQGEADRAQEWIERMLNDARAVSASREAHGLYMRSVAYTSVGDVEGGIGTAEAATRAARQSGSPTSQAQAAYALGLALEASDQTAAEALLVQAADVAGKAGNRWIRAFALTEVYWLQARRGSPHEALQGFAEVIELWWRGGDWANQWLSLRHVFGILAQLEEYRAAATLHGALAAVGAAYALPFEASDAEHLHAMVERLRDAMGTAEFAACVRSGASMSDREIVEFTLDRIRLCSMT